MIHRMVLLFLYALTATAQTNLPVMKRITGTNTPANVLAVMERAADWQLAHPSTHRATDWTQGAGDAGMMALAGISGQPKYREAMRAMGQTNGWKPGPNFYSADESLHRPDLR